MTMNLNADCDARGDLAAFLSDQVQMALGAGNGAAIDIAFFERAFAGFEVAARDKGKLVRVEVSSRSEDEYSIVALANEMAAAASPHLQDAVRDAVEADPVAFVKTLVQENESLRSEVKHGNMLADVHNELVDSVKDLVGELERKFETHPQLPAIKALIAKAEEARTQGTSIPAGVSPMRLITTFEKIVNSHYEIVSQFGRHMPSNVVAQGVSVLSDALKLLEEIHGPVDRENVEEIETNSPGTIPG